MRLMNIASGSSGNATYVGSDNTHILIDSGISRKKIQEGLKKLDLSLKDINAILVTHEHTDHISSLAVVERAVEIPVYTTAGTAAGIISKSCMQGRSDLFANIKANIAFSIGDIEITALNTSHDANEPVCYRFRHAGSECAVVTDLGMYDDYLLNNLRNLSAVIVEANHDVRMLEAGPYPYSLKMRVAGEKGHLSNESCGKLLAGILDDNMKYIALGHLSSKNNNPDLARLAVQYEIDASETKYRAGDFRIDIADQEKGTEIYSF